MSHHLLRVWPQLTLGQARTPLEITGHASSENYVHEETDVTAAQEAGPGNNPGSSSALAAFVDQPTIVQTIECANNVLILHENNEELVEPTSPRSLPPSSRS